MMNNNFHKRILLWSVAAIAVSLSSCASNPAEWGERTNSRIKHEIKEAKDISSLKKLGVPKAISRAMLPPLEISVPKKKFDPVVNEFDLSVHKANVRDVYLNIVKDTPYSVMLEPDIKGNVSFSLKSVNLHEVFDHLQSSHGFFYERKGTKFLVYGNSLRSKIFHVNYLNLVREGSSKSVVSSGGISDGGGSGVNITTSNSIKFWDDLTESLKAIIGEVDGRKVVVNRHSGFMVVNALPKELDLVESFLSKLESNIVRQVILEAKLLEVDLNDSFQSGINWGKLFSSGSSSLTLSQTGGGTSLSGSGVTGNQGSSTSNILSAPVSALGSTAFGGVFSVALQSNNFGAFIEMIQTQGDVHILSSPRISAINNQKAVIKVGGEEFYITNITQNNDNSNSGNSDNSSQTQVEMKSFFSGIALDVTPQIDEDGYISLHLHPTVSDVTQKNKAFIIGGEGFDLPLAASTVRETDTVVRARSEQIIVVGGLMKEATVESVASVPILGDLPLIGRLFRHESVTRVKKELVVLVKPTIADSGGGRWDAEASDTLHRFSSLQH